MSAAVLLICAAAVAADRSCAQSAPAKPTGFAAEDGNTQVRLSWTGPSDSTITGWQYTYKRKTAGSYPGWTDMPGSGADTRRFTVTGLINNIDYKFKVRAVNPVGNGRESDEKIGSPYPAPPEKPTGFKAAPGDRSVLLTWNDADDISINGWEYRQKEADGSYGGKIPIPGSDETTTSHTVTGLKNGTRYSFKILAYNTAGTGSLSDEKSATPMPQAPAKPTGFSAAAGNRKVTLSWNDPGDGTIASWQYAYKTTGDYGDWTDMAGSGAATVRHVVSTLENDTSYTFKVRAVNSVGGGAESDEVSATPMAAAPEKPTGFAVRARDAQVALSWTDPSDASIRTWQYAYKTTGDYGDWTDISDSRAKTTGHTVSELTNGTAYTFKVRGVNDVGPGPESDEASATPLAVPAKPGGFTVKAGDAQATLEWTDPGNDTITGWQYAYKTTGAYGSWTNIPGSGAATAAYTVTGLDNDVGHTFKLRAVNASGEGAESDEAAATPIPVPAKPSGFRTEAGNTQVRLLWTDPADSSITGWRYRYKTSGDYGGWTDIPGSGASTVRYTVTGLANGTAHTFRLRAVNGSGDGPQSDEASATPELAPPEKPTGFRVAPGDGRAVLTWNDPDDSSIEGWQYRKRADGEEYGQYWTNIPGSDATTVRHTVTGLDNGKTYFFVLRAVNYTNGVVSDERSAALPPAKPAGFTATPGDRQVALAWTDPDNDTITGWQYARKTTGDYGAWTTIPKSGAATTAYAVKDLDNDTTYTFKLRAVNPSGNGAESDEATATPVAVPAKPTGFSATPGDSLVALAWTDPDNDTITGWQYAQKTTDNYSAWKAVPNGEADTTAYTVTGLENSTAYAFKLRAVNPSGNGEESNEVSATPIAVPAKPTGFSATPGDSQVTLAWTDPGNDTITGWQYAQKATGDYGAWKTVPNSGADTAAYAVTGLENDTAYTFKLRAVNASGNGTASDEATATPVAVPAKPTGFTATPGDGQVALSWTDPDNDTITGWKYAYKTTGGYGEWTDISDSGAATVSHTITGLDNGKSHTFKLRAVNPSGDGTASDEATATPIAVPAKPTGFTATPGDGQVALSWTDPGNDTITGWQYAQKTTGDYGAWKTVPNSGVDTAAYTVTGLENDTAYTFKLRAANASGNGTVSDEATATPIAVPAKPTGFTATPGDSQVALAWTDPDNDTITGWQYAYKTTGGYGEWKVVPNSGADTAAYTVTGLDNGTAYTFKLRAANASGNGTASDEATATPIAVPAKPTGLTATAGDAQVQLAWDDPSNTTITGWQYAYKTTGGYGAWKAVPNSGSDTTAYTVTGLDNGTAYTFKLRAANASGNGTASDEATATPVAVPAKPTGFTATPGDRQVALAWTDPDNDTITGWQYARKTTGDYGAWTTIPKSGAATTAYAVKDLDNDTTYTFKLRAVNPSGNGAESDEATATPVAVPAKPTGFSATPGDSLVALAWTDPDNDTITGWQYAQKTTDNYSAWKAVPNGEADTTAYTVTGLENSTAYAFKLRAVNPSGNGEESNEVSATPIAVPAKPTGFSATPGDSQVTLAWTDPGNDTITGWQYAQKATGDYGAWKTVPNSGADTAAYAVTGLENDTAYTFPYAPPHSAVKPHGNVGGIDRLNSNSQ